MIQRYKKYYFFTVLIFLIIYHFYHGQTVHPVLAEGPIAVAQNSQFGLVFVNSPDQAVSEARLTGAVEAGAAWDRWPLYWHWVDEGGYVGEHAGGSHDYDRVVIENISHGLQSIAILLGTPDRRASAGSAQVGPPLLQDKHLPIGDGPPISLTKVTSPTFSSATAASQGLFEPIFTDGTDRASPGKAVNAANDWATFVAQSVQRYMPDGSLAQGQGWTNGEGVRYWEIWNEPDLDQFWNGSVEDYHRLMQVAYNAIKATDPEAVVIFGGLAFFEDPNFLANYLALLKGDPSQAYFDILGYHYYWSIYGGEAKFKEVRALLDAHGLEAVSIWITESGLPVWDDDPAAQYNVPADSPWRGTMEEQAAYIIQKAATAFYNGVGLYTHFMIHDDCGNALPDAFGLRQNFSPHACNPAQGLHRPGYAAYQLAAEQFRALQPLSREQDEHYDLLVFQRPDDQMQVSVFWAKGGTHVDVTIPSQGNEATLYWVANRDDLIGDSLSPQSLTVYPINGGYALRLPAATNQNSSIPNDSNFYIGGRPYILVECPYPCLDTTRPVPGEDYLVYLPLIAKPDSPRLQAISGQVINAVGTPISDTVVTITAADNRVIESFITDSEGIWSGQVWPGAYQLTAHAETYPAWPSPRYLTITSPITNILLTLAPFSNTIEQGDFEGDQVWTVWQRPKGQIELTRQAFDGLQALRLGDLPGTQTRCFQNNQAGAIWTLEQTVIVPDIPQPHLSFLVQIDTSQPEFDYAWLEVVVINDDQPVYLLDWENPLWQSPAWRLINVDMSSWRGQQIALRFQAVNCTAQTFVVTLDRIILGAASLGDLDPDPDPTHQFSATSRTLTACENRGKHNLFIRLRDKNDVPLPDINIRVRWNNGDEILITGTKAEDPGLVDFPMFGGDFWVSLVDFTGPEMGPFNTDIDRLEYCGEEVGNSRFHYSFEIIYRQEE